MDPGLGDSTANACVRALKHLGGRTITFVWNVCIVLNGSFVGAWDQIRMERAEDFVSNYDQIHRVANPGSAFLVQRI
jgi:hypothetical protein